MTNRLRWLAGEPELRPELERALLGDGAGGLEVLRERAPLRRIARLRLAGGDALRLKQHYAPRGRPLRSALKRALALDAPQREWRGLTRLRAAALAVPEPRALVELPGGDRVLATTELEGRPLAEALGRESGARRRALLAALGAEVARLHRAGFVHGDLHAGNVLLTAAGPVLLDAGGVRRTRGRRARLRDLGELDNSLSRALSRSDRVRLRAAALGCIRPFAPEARRALRAVGRAAQRSARTHAASRTRRAGRPGAEVVALRLGAYRGLRLREAAEADLTAALAAHLRGADAAPPGTRSRITAAQLGPQRVRVKQVVSGGALRRAADLLRGSPGRRAWRGGHGLCARRIGAARPLAFVERRRWGVPVASHVVLEDLESWPSADRCAPTFARPDEVVDALVRLLLALHRRAVVHGDLKASHVRLVRRGERLEAHLIDLEGVRFPRRLGEGQRVRALAQLNASLGDAVPDALRHRAFVRYASALPFRAGARAALERVVEQSLARRHRWHGEGCALAARLRS